MLYKIYAPNVHLFAFHLKDSHQPNLLWNKCNHLLSQKFGVSKLLEIEDHEGYRVDLLKYKTNDDVSLRFDSTVYQNGTPLAICGFGAPLRIHDSYILILNLRRPEEEDHKKTNPVELTFLKLLNPSGCLMPNQIGSSLSQTILLTVWYTSEQQGLSWKLPPNRQQLRELADNCLKAFIPDNYPVPSFNQEGLLFGSPIFEYGIPYQEEDYCHVVVWVYCESETSEKFVENYNKFVNLFHFFNKIIVAYHRSRKVYQVIRQDDRNNKLYIENIFKEIPVDKSLNQEDLSQFKQYLKDLPQKYLLYSELINELNNYQLTIEINTQNYRREIVCLQSRLPSENLSFLTRFADEDSRILTEQIQADLRYFQNGAALLEKAMTAIQGRVEIEQTESDRITQDLLHQKEETDRTMQGCRGHLCRGREENPSLGKPPRPCNRSQAPEFIRGTAPKPLIPHSSPQIYLWGFPSAPCALQRCLFLDKIRDRDLQTTIAIVGVGLGAAGIGSSTAPYIIPQQPNQPILPPFMSSHLHPLTQSLIFSLFCGFVGAIVAGGLSYLIQNRSAILGCIFKFNQITKHK